MSFPLFLAALGLGALALSSSDEKKSSGPGAAPAGPGAGGPLSTADLGVENVGGVLRYRPDVANALLSGVFTKYSVTPGGVGQARKLVPLQPGLDIAGVWAFYQAVYGYAVLVSNDGRQPGELLAASPEQVPQLASAVAGQWAVLLAPSAGVPAVQQPPNALAPYNAPAPAGPPLPGQVPQFGQLGAQLGGYLQQLGAQLGIPVPQTPAQPPAPGPAPGPAPAPGGAPEAPAGWATYPTQIEASTGTPRLADAAIPTFGAWLAQRTIMPDPGDPSGGTVVLVAGGAQNALAWTLQRTALGQYVLAPRTAPTILRAADAASAKANAAAWLIVAAPVGAAPQPGPAPQPQPGPAPQPYQPQPQVPPAGPAVPPFFPTPPAGSPLAQAAQQLGQLGGQVLGQFGIPVPGQAPAPAPQPGPAPAAGATPTPNVDALPPDIRAQIAAASVAGDTARLEQIAAALAPGNPAAAAEVKQLAIDAKLARRQRAILEGRLVTIRAGDLPSIWAQWYTGSAGRWTELLKYNGIGTVKANGTVMPDPRRWKAGEEIELPPGWNASKGLPPVAKGGARQVTADPLAAANAVVRRA